MLQTLRSLRMFTLLFALTLSLIPFTFGAKPASANSWADWYWTDNQHMAQTSTSAKIIFNTISSQAMKDITGGTTNTSPYRMDVSVGGWYAGNNVSFDSYSGAAMPNMWNDKNITTLVGYNGFRYQPPVWYVGTYSIYPHDTVNFLQQYLKKIVDVAYVEMDSRGNTTYEAHMIMTIIHYQGPGVEKVY